MSRHLFVVAAGLIAAACSPQAPAPAPPTSSTPEAVATTPTADAQDRPSDKAVECIAYLDLARDGIGRGVLQGDAQLMAAASRNYYAVARQDMTEDEYAQYRASSIAVFDDTAPAELLTKANACVAGAVDALPTPTATPSAH